MDAETSGPGEENVFNKFVKTVTFHSDYKNDGKDADFKLLDKDAVNSTEAMKGIQPGTKQMRIRGNSAYHYVGDHYVFVDGKDVLLVQGIQEQTIQGNVRLLCLSDYLRGVRGNEAIRINKTRSLISTGSEPRGLRKHA